MKILIIFTMVMICANSSLAQNITLSGKVIDKETKEPLIFASVGIKGKSQGTITNLLGEFDFHIPGESRNDFLMINMMGYNPYEVPVWSIMESDSLVIEMEKSIIVLEEVVITDSLKGTEILQIALSRIESNYPMKPYLLNGFYRDLKKVAGTYISLLEAAVKIYDEDYAFPRSQTKLRERVALQEVRRSLGYGSRFTEFFDQDNLLEVLLLHNSVRYRLFPEEQSFYNNLIRLKDSFYDGQSIFVLTHKPSDEFQFTVYIEKKTYAIIHLEYADNTEIYISKKRGLESKLVSSHRVIDFKRFNDKLYLNYMSLDIKVNWYDIETKEFKFDTELNQSLLINDVSPNTSERIHARQKMKAYGLHFQDPPYNKGFWDNYNMLKYSPLDKKIIEDLERLGPLEKQFDNK